MVRFSRQRALKPVTSNIRYYLKNAILPRMKLSENIPRPPKHFHLSHRIQLHGIRPDRHRFLKHVCLLDFESLEKQVLEFVKEHIPSTPVASREAEQSSEARLCIPCAGYNVEGMTFFPLSHVQQMSACWIPTVLQTAHRILEMIPEYQEEVKHYHFTMPSPLHDIDSEDFQYLLWEKKADAAEGLVSNGDAKCIVSAMPVWSLSPHDMQHFRRVGAIPGFNHDHGAEQPRYNSAHRLWGKLHDICKQRDCHHFALTNYHDWIFGGFSPQYQFGFISQMKVTIFEDKETLKGPTMLEYLIFWLTSSMGMANGLQFPLVVEELTLDAAQNGDDGNHVPNVLNPPFLYQRSESSWSHNTMDIENVEIASSAGVHMDMISEAGEDSLAAKNENWQQYTKNGLSRSKQSRLQAWQLKLGGDLQLDMPPTPVALSRFASPAPSEFSVFSSAARVPNRFQGFSTMDIVPEAEESMENALDLNFCADEQYFKELAFSAEHNIDTMP